MTHSEQINEISAALAKAQGEMEGAKKGSVNPHFRSKYADLASVREACAEALAKHGICYPQWARLVNIGEGWLVEVETFLSHTSGQWMRDTLAVPVTKVDAQGVGSAITYARRYALAAVTGVAPEDDDANAAVGTTEAHAARPPDGAMETVKVKVTGIVQRQLSSGGTKYTITASDRQTYSTLKKALAESAKAAQEAGSEIELTWKQTQYGRDVVGINELVEVPL